jgi:hypothetical protein
MTKIISCSISDEDKEFIERFELSPSKLIQSAIEIARTEENGDLSVLLKGQRAKIERLSQIIAEKQKEIWEKEEVINEFRDKSEVVDNVVV